MRIFKVIQHYLDAFTKLRKKCLAYFKRCLLAGIVVSSIMTSAEAKELPEVIWTPDIYTMNIAGDDDSAKARRNYQLLNTGTNEQLKAENKHIFSSLQ